VLACIHWAIVHHGLSAHRLLPAARSFDEYAQVTETYNDQDYDRTAEKPWTCLSTADKVRGSLFPNTRSPCCSGRLLTACRQILAYT